MSLAAVMAVAAAAAALEAGSVWILSADGAPVSLLLAPAGAEKAAAQSTLAPMPNLYNVPDRCRDVRYRVVDQNGRPVAARLADLPAPGGLQLLVDRQIDGCRVITVKQGRVAPDEPNPPPERYRIMPLGERSHRR